MQSVTEAYDNIMILKQSCMKLLHLSKSVYCVSMIMQAFDLESLGEPTVDLECVREGFVGGVSVSVCVVEEPTTGMRGV